LKLGVAIGYDMKGPMLSSRWGSFVDHFYLEMYDFYSPLPHIDRGESSRFLMFQDDPQKLWSYIKNEVLVGELPQFYKDHADKAHLMWSLQSTKTTDCLYPMDDGCGTNHEFGSWRPNRFNEFIGLVKKDFPKNKQGIFQFSFWPNSFSH